MARRLTEVKISAENRDTGKVFLIKEMPASQAEWWAIRALLAVAKSGMKFQEGFVEGGMASLASLFSAKRLLEVLGQLDPWEAKPLLDELFTCVKIMPSATNPNVTRELIEDDIEEVQTRALLKWEVLMLHLNFSRAADK